MISLRSDEVMLVASTFLESSPWLVPNQPHLLNKYQINVGFSHFHEFEILSGMQLLAPYQIDIVEGCGFCNGSIILILY